MMSELGEIKSAIRDRLHRIANNVENHRLDNVEYEINLILAFLTDLSYHEDVSECMNLCTLALEEIAQQPGSGLDNQGKPETVQNASGMGRPSYNIKEETVLFFVENGFTIKEIASVLRVSDRTIVNRMKDFGISVRNTYSDISDDDLEQIVKQKVAEFPSVGYRSIRGHLMADGIKVSFQRIKRVMRIVDPLGVLLRNILCRTYRVRRRSYSVRAPRALWHIDSYHKLIRWRFVIHGGIDGFSRLPMYMKVASNNTADTALAAFQSGINDYGIPERVRTDKGMENIKIAEFMLHTRGLDRGSHITGRSVHNQRIERFWRELWDGCARSYYELFSSMEREGILDVDSEVGLLALHIVYLQRIQKSIDCFISAIARRPLRTEQSRTPMQMWIMGQIEDTADVVSPEDLAFYGVDFDSQEYIHERNATEIVVPPLLQLDQDTNDDITRIANQPVDSPYDTRVYEDICAYLSRVLPT